MLKKHLNQSQKDTKMASYFESGFTVLKELSKEKKEKETLEVDDAISAGVAALAPDDAVIVCKDDKKCTQRYIEAYSDCD